MGLDIGRECRGAGDLSDLQRAGYGCRCPGRGYDAKGNPLSGFGTGTGIWLLVSTLASLAAGAFVAGRTAPNRGGLHGLLSWAITTLLTTWLVVSLASGVVGLAGSAVGKGLSLAGSGLAAAAPNVGEGLKQQLDKRASALTGEAWKTS